MKTLAAFAVAVVLTQAAFAQHHGLGVDPGRERDQDDCLRRTMRSLTARSRAVRID
jgi:hypothetical protein